MRFHAATEALFWVLTISLALETSSAAAQAPPFSYRGLYEATLTDGTNAYFFVRKDGDGRYARFDSVNLTVSNGLFTVAANGSFAFMVGAVPVAGTFSASAVTGTIGALAFAIPRATLNSVQGSLEGYYSGWMFLSQQQVDPLQTIELVFTPAGKFYALVTRSPFSNGPFPSRDHLGTYAANGNITSREITQGFQSDGAATSKDGVLDGSLFTSFLARYYFKAPKDSVPYRLINISTRAFVGTGANQAIAGFVIKNGAKRVLVRVIGPSLATQLPGALPDPSVTLYSGSTAIASNDNWKNGNDVAAVTATGFAPTDDRECVLLVTLEEGAYTAIVSGVGGSTGVAVVEVYEID